MAGIYVDSERVCQGSAFVKYNYGQDGYIVIVELSGDVVLLHKNAQRFILHASDTHVVIFPMECNDSHLPIQFAGRQQQVIQGYFEVCMKTWGC